MKKITFFLIFLFVAELFGQSGSVYSRFGIGDLRYSFSARRLGLGDLGIALADKDYLNSLNPAGWNSMRLTRFEVSLLYSGNSIKNSSSSVYHANSYFNGMMMGFPLKEDLGISVAFGLVPYSNVKYEVAQAFNDPLVSDYSLRLKGSGGLSKFFFGTSYRLPFDFSLGINYDYYFGKIENNTLADFPVSSSIKDASFVKQTNYHGMGITAGLISNDLSGIFGSTELKDFRIGIVFTPTVTLSADSVNSSSTAYGTIVTSTGSIKNNLPLKFGIGASIKISNDYTFLLDYLYQPFSEYNSNGIKDANLQNYYKIGLGFEYRKDNNRSNDYWTYAMYRAGISYEQTPFNVNGTSINQFSIYAGMSLPLSYDNTLDFALQYGRRGTVENNLLQESIFKFTVSLSIGEFWFIQTDR